MKQAGNTEEQPLGRGLTAAGSLYAFKFSVKENVSLSMNMEPKH